MATFKKRGDGWQARVRRKLPGQPKASALTRTFKTKGKAERWAAAKEAEILSGRYQDDRQTSKMLMADLLAWYLATIIPARAVPSSEASRLKALAWFNSTSVLAVTPFQIVDYAVARLNAGRKPGTVRRELGMLGDVFTSAMTFQVVTLQANPVTAALSIIRKKRLIPPAGKRDRRLRPGELQALCSVKHAKPTQVIEVTLFAIESPMREGEIAAMLEERMDWKRSLYYLDKAKMDYKTGQTGRTMPLSPLALDILRSLPPREDGKLWAFKTGGSIGQAHRRNCKAAGVTGLTFHDLRHEGTSRYGDRGYDPFKLMVITGHKDLRSVQRYTHLNPEKVAAGMR